MSSDQLAPILSNLKDEESRWEGILELKMLDYPGLGDDLKELLHDPEWIIRWCVAEKLGDMKFEPAIPGLVERLSDSDAHVRKNVIKALYKLGLPTVPFMAPHFANKNPQIRKYVSSLLMKFGKPALDPLSKSITDQSWIVSNRIVEMLWKIGGVESEVYLIRQLVNPKVQKNVINLLGFIPSNRCVRALVKAYQHPPLKRMILHTLARIGIEETYPLLVRTMFDDDVRMAQIARAMVVKIGESIMPFVLIEMPKRPENKDLFMKLIMKISPKTKDMLAKASEDDPQLKFYVNQLKSRLGPDDKPAPAS